MELLKAALNPYVVREMRAAHGPDWWKKVGGFQSDPREMDASVLLRLMRGDQWGPVFGRKLGPAERNLVHELTDVRNRWAHQEPFTLDDTYRALDSLGRLLTAISTASQAAEVEREKSEVLRLRFEEQALRETRRAPAEPVESRPAEGLKLRRDGEPKATNRERIIGFLKTHPEGADDDALSAALDVRPRQQVNLICRALAQAGLVSRRKGPPDWKIVNRWVGAAEKDGPTRT
jgi:hypothetical protein